MTDLERALAALRPEVGFPPTPPIAAAVAGRLREEGEQPGGAPAARAPRLPLRRALALALLGVLLAAATAIAAVPSARDAVLDFFGLQGATIERTRTLPDLPVDDEPWLGSPASLREARAELGFRPLLPAALGRPDGVFVRSRPSNGELSLTYEPAPPLPRTGSTGVGLLVTEFRGDLHPDYVGKIVAEATRVEPLRIGGERAVWVAGAPHFFFYRDQAGDSRLRGLRLAANVLLLERGRLLVRLEGELSRATAISIAESLR